MTTKLSPENHAEIASTTDPSIRDAFRTLCLAEADFWALCAERDAAHGSGIAELELIELSCGGAAQRLKNALWNNEGARFRALLLTDLLLDLSRAAAAERMRLVG